MALARKVSAASSSKVLESTEMTGWLMTSRTWQSARSKQPHSQKNSYVEQIFMARVSKQEG
jgi:hypothetical protein